MTQAQTEILTLLPGGKKLVVVDVTGLELTDGVGVVTVDSVRRVDTMLGSIPTNDLTDNYVLAYDFGTDDELEPNQIAVTVSKMQISATNTWGAAEDADVADAVIRIAVIGA